MRIHRSRSGADQCSPDCGTPATLDPGGWPVEQHAADCSVFEPSRPVRERDWAALADRPAGHVLVRPLDPAELADVAELADPVHAPIPPASRSERRRWRVAVTAVQRDGVAHLARQFRRDGKLVGALIDSTPMVGAR